MLWRLQILSDVLCLCKLFRKWCVWTRARAYVCRLQTGLRFYWMLSQDSSFNSSPRPIKCNFPQNSAGPGLTSHPPNHRLYRAHASALAATAHD